MSLMEQYILYSLSCKWLHTNKLNMHKLKSENEVEALKFGLINEKKTKEEKGILCREDGE